MRCGVNFMAVAVSDTHASGHLTGQRQITDQVRSGRNVAERLVCIIAGIIADRRSGADRNQGLCKVSIPGLRTYLVIPTHPLVVPAKAGTQGQRGQRE